MRALVVYCHPNEDSLSAQLRDAAVRGLKAAKHEVTIVDLAQDNFNPVMPLEEWTSYLDTSAEPAEDVKKYMELVEGADILVFVYPSWWSGVPAQLKGWLERVFIAGLAFEMGKKGLRRGYLKRIRRIHVITTFGSPRWYVRFVNDNGRRLFSRAVRLCMSPKTRYKQHSLYAMDKQTQEQKQNFVVHVEQAMQKI